MCRATCHNSEMIGLLLTTREPAWHGTAGGYINHDCRCIHCKRAHADAVRRYRLRQSARGLCVNCSQPATRGLRCTKHAEARLAYARRRSGKERSRPSESIALAEARRGKVA